MGDTGEVTEVLGGRYRLEHLLGRGGMGEVWAGHDTVLNRPVAVKMLRDDLGTDPERNRERLLAEARSAASVRHPNLVTTFDAGSDDGAFALVMERLSGPSLAERLAEGPLSTGELRALAIDVLAGLDAVHEAGMVHRDVKPANVLQAADGRWKLVDFGIAKSVLEDMNLTATGTIIGTPTYLAPEQLNGQTATPSADLWAVGVLLYQAVSGQLPFTGDTPIAIGVAVHTAEPEPISVLCPDADPAIAATIERALHKSPDERFESASAMALSLRPSAAPLLTPTTSNPATSNPTGSSPTTSSPTTSSPAATASTDDTPAVEGASAVDAEPVGPLGSVGRRPLVLSLVAASLVVVGLATMALGNGSGGPGTDSDRRSQRREPAAAESDPEPVSDPSSDDVAAGGTDAGDPTSPRSGDTASRGGRGAEKPPASGGRTTSQIAVTVPGDGAGVDVTDPPTTNPDGSWPTTSAPGPTTPTTTKPPGTRPPTTMRPPTTVPPTTAPPTTAPPTTTPPTTTTPPDVTLPDIPLFPDLPGILTSPPAEGSV